MNTQRAVEDLEPSERGTFHNVLLKVEGLARKSNSTLGDTVFKELVGYSKQVSPVSDPSAWLGDFADKWSRSGKTLWQPSGNVAESALKALDGWNAQVSAARHAQEGSMNFITMDYRSGEMPEFTAAFAAGPQAASGLREWLDEYGHQKEGAVTAVLGLEDGRCLGLAYDPEDIATSEVFAALKWKGYKLDPQAEAQVEAFDRFAREELASPLAQRARELAEHIPGAGPGKVLTGLEQLHSQAHVYDMEALDYTGPSARER